MDMNTLMEANAPKKVSVIHSLLPNDEMGPTAIPMNFDRMDALDVHLRTEYLARLIN